MTKHVKFEVPSGFKKMINDRMLSEGLSLRKLAERCGMSVSFLSRILSGERGLPKNKDILKIARALKIKPPERLLYEAGMFELKNLNILNLFRKVGLFDFKRQRQLTELAERLRKNMESEKKEGK